MPSNPMTQDGGEVLRGQHERWKLAQARLGYARPKPVIAAIPEGAWEESPDDVPWGAPINLLGTPGPRTVIRLVALRAGISTAELTGPSRVRPLVALRGQAIGLIWTHCRHLSLPALGRLFGDRDHTTILHTLRKLRLSGNTFYRRQAQARFSPIIHTTHRDGAGGSISPLAAQDSQGADRMQNAISARDIH